MMLKQEKIQSLIDQLNVDVKDVPMLIHDRSQAVLGKFDESGMLRSNRTLLGLKQGLLDLVEERIQYVWQNLRELLEHDIPSYSKRLNGDIKAFLTQNPYLKAVQGSAKDEEGPSRA